MKASIAHHQRPSALILGKGSDKPWSRTDVVFAKAYQRYLEELCPACGLPKYICHTDDNRIQFKAVTDYCASAARAEEKQDQNANSKSKAKHFGERIFGEPYLTDAAKAEGLEFSDFRRPYYRDLAKKKGLIPDTTVSETGPETPVS